MEKLYKVNDNMAEITISKKVYPLIAIKKAIANYIEDIYIKLEDIEENVIIKLQLKKDEIDIEKIIGEFYNELLRESLRYDISRETKNLRELIIARALYTTCIDTDEDKKIFENPNENKTNNLVQEEFDINEIAVNWFDTNNNREKKC